MVVLMVSMVINVPLRVATIAEITNVTRTQPNVKTAWLRNTGIRAICHVLAVRMAVVSRTMASVRLNVWTAIMESTVGRNVMAIVTIDDVHRVTAAVQVAVRMDSMEVNAPNDVMQTAETQYVNNRMVCV